MFEATLNGQNQQALGLKSPHERENSPISPPSLNAQVPKERFPDSLHWKGNWDVKGLPLVMFSTGINTELLEHPLQLSSWRTPVIPQNSAWASPPGEAFDETILPATFLTPSFGPL